MDIEFIWDERKRQLNLRKHRVDFADAVEVFYDDLACAMEDPDHHDEQRLVLTGIDAFGRVLVVVYAPTGRTDHPYHLGAASHSHRAPTLRERLNHA